MLRKLRKYVCLSIFIISSLIYSSSCAKAKIKPEIENIIIEEDIQNFSAEKVEEMETVVEEKIFVYICGQVKNAGVYELPADARLVDLLAMAGGFSENANKTYNNLAMRLEDEQKIYIPSIDEKVSENLSENIHAGEKLGGKVNLNTATKEELMNLRGVGSSKAEQIIEFRNKNGGFRNIEDIMKIKGIKKSAFNKIKDSIYVE